MRNLLLFFVLILTRCAPFDSDSDTITGNYEVMWVDVREQRAICERDGTYSSAWGVLVDEYVFAAGHDNNFIIAKQHPLLDHKPGEEFKIDTTVTNYFIIDMRKVNNKVLGPLTREEFMEKRKELNIEKIEFDMNYPEVP